MRVFIAREGSRTYRDIKRAVRHVLYNNRIIRVSDKIYFRLINSAKYSIPAMRDNYTVQQFEGIVQNELDAIDGVGLKC